MASILVSCLWLAQPASGGGIESFSTTASAILILHRRTFYRTVRTKNAAVARLGAQQGPTVGAFVEKLACVGRHLLSLREAADRTHEDGLENNLAHYTITCGLPKITRVRS